MIPSARSGLLSAQRDKKAAKYSKEHEIKQKTSEVTLHRITSCPDLSAKVRAEESNQDPTMSEAGAGNPT
jgi:hypothetical protein